MKKLIHLTDLHIKKGELKAHAQEIQSLILSRDLQKNPNYDPKDYALLITGDFVDTAEDITSWEFASAWLNALKNAGYDLYVCPGNHDVFKGGITNAPGLRSNFDSYILEDVLGLYDVSWPLLHQPEPGFALIGLDSNAGPTAQDNKFTACGEIGTEQLDRLRAMLASLPTTTRVIVYLHHHVVDVEGLVDVVGLSLLDANQLLDILRHCGRPISAVIFGHTHRGFNYWHPQQPTWPLIVDGGTSTAKGGCYSPFRILEFTTTYNYTGNNHTFAQSLTWKGCTTKVEPFVPIKII